MKKKKGLNLRNKIILAQSLLIIALIAVFTFTSFMFTKNSEEAALDNKMTRLTEQLSEHVSSPLWFFSLDTVEILLLERIEDDNLIGLLIKQDQEIISGKIKLDGQSIVNFDDPKGAPVLKGASFIKRAEIKNEDENLGTLEVYISSANLEDQLSNQFVSLVTQSLVLTVILIVFTSVIIHLIILKPVNRVSGALKEISQGGGDLTYAIEIKSLDEIGSLSHYFNTFIETLKGIVVKLKGSFMETIDSAQKTSGEVNISASNVNEISKKIESIREQFAGFTRNINDAAAAVKQIFSTVTNVSNRISSQAAAVMQSSASIEEIAASIENVSRVSSDKTKYTTRMMELTTVGSEKLDNTSEIITEIAKDVEGMITIVEVINTIASQTDLLSMNAAIEAAHAGTYGKGFAVVASEIRNLAESTADNAKQINSTLRTSIERMQTLKESSMETQKAFDDIKESVNFVTSALVEISTSMSEMAEGNSSVIESITFLQEITKEVDREASEMAKDTEVISGSMENITKISMNFAEVLNEIDLKGKEINKAMLLINDLSNKSYQNTLALHSEMDLFKTE